MKTPHGSVWDPTPQFVLMAACLSALLTMGSPSAVRGEATKLQAFPRFPAQKNDAATEAWLRQSTSVDPADVILIGDGAILAIRPGAQETTADGKTVTPLREELTSPRLERRLGGRSSTVSVSFDCAASQYKLSNPLVFTGSNLLVGPGRFMDPGDWLKATPDWAFELPKVFCGAGFKRPFDPTKTAPPLTPPPPAAAPPTPSPSEDQPLAKVPALPAKRSSNAYWVQAGAVPSVALAEAAWERIKSAMPAETGHRTEAVTKPVRLYRLLIGPYDSRASALSACEVLKRSNVDCFVR